MGRGGCVRLNGNAHYFPHPEPFNELQTPSTDSHMRSCPVSSKFSKLEDVQVHSNAPWN